MNGGEAPVLLCPAIRVPDFEPCPAYELELLLEWIAGDHRSATPVTFTRGTALPDGRLDLCKQALGVEGAIRVLESIDGNRHIRSLLLGTEGLGDRGATAAAALIREARAPALETLYLGCNHIGEPGIAALSDALAREDSPVRALWLKRNPIGPEGALRIAELLRSQPGLRVLDLTNTGLTDAGAVVIAEALREQAEGEAGLECLLIGSNGVGLRGAEALADLLAVTSHLRELTLSVSRLADAGAKALARGLAQNRSLEALDLGSCAIGPAGLMALLEACVELPRLHTLDLGTTPSTLALGERDNALGDAEGGRLLGDYLRRQPALRRLDLRGAGIRSKGALAIDAALDENHTLLECRLGKHVARKIKRRIAAKLERHRSDAPELPGVPEHVKAILSVYRSKR